MLKKFAAYVVFNLFNLEPGTHLGEAINFFIYDTIKVFFLLIVIIFFVAIIRSYLPPERTRRILSRNRQYLGNGLAGLLGIVTPFCSCSAVPPFHRLCRIGSTSRGHLLFPHLLSNDQ